MTSLSDTLTSVKNPNLLKVGGFGSVILASSKRGSSYPQINSSGVFVTHMLYSRLEKEEGKIVRKKLMTFDRSILLSKYWGYKNKNIFPRPHEINNKVLGINTHRHKMF